MLMFISDTQNTSYREYNKGTIFVLFQYCCYETKTA